MLPDKPWWNWTVRLVLLFAAFLISRERQLLAVSDSAPVISEQYVWLAGAAAVAMLFLAVARQGPSRIGWPDLLVLALAIPPVVWWILDRGMTHIGGYEHSLLANYGWMQLQGMQPHIDFPCTLNPHFYLGVKYAFTWFGVAWRSTVILAAIYASVSFTWTYFLLRALDLPRCSAAVVCLLAQSLCLMMAGYFWYNSVGSTDCIILFLSALAWIDRPRSVTLFASLTVALGLVMLDKPNGWVLPACLAVGFLGSREHRYRFAGCASALGIVLVVAWFGPFDLGATLFTYSRLARSRHPGMEAVWHSLQFDDWYGFWVESGKLYVFAATFLMASVASLWVNRLGWRAADGRWWARLCAYAGALGVGAALFFTNYEMKCTDLAVPTVAFAVWVARCEPWRGGRLGASPRRFAVVLGAWVCLFCMCQGLLDGWNRYRIFFICPNDFWQEAVSNQAPATAFLAGARGSPRLIKVMNDLEHAVGKHPRETIFFGPWIEFAYPAYGRKPPAGFPAWWHPGTSYFPEDGTVAVKTFSARQIDILIFLKRRCRERQPLSNARGDRGAVGRLVHAGRMS